MWTTVALVVTLLAIFLYWLNYRPAHFPPGPFILPLFGNALSILLLTPKTAFKNFAKSYGGIFSFKVFNDWSVMINDPGLMRTALADQAFSGRIKLLLFDVRDQILNHNKAETPALGIISTKGEVWKSQRRFTLRTLKDLGFGRNAVESIMQSELEELLEHFTRQQGEKVDVGLLFNRSIVNVIWAIVAGNRFSHDDKKLEDLVNKVNRMLQTFNPFHPALRFRWIQKIFPSLKIIRTTHGYMRDLMHFIEGEMAQHSKETGKQVDMGSYMGAYHHAMTTSDAGEGDAALSLNHLTANVMELFLAGSETTSSTLWWAIYLLATNPTVQQAVQEELDKVVGPDNMPSLAHMDSLIYTTATIYEVQRKADLVPFAIPHETMEDAVVGGYRIPKGMAVMFNLSHGLQDPKYWKDPEKFSPEHFLTEDGKLFKPDHFMPFGSGKRVCLGESLARLELFFFLTSLLHRFTWFLSEDPVKWEKSTVISRAPNFTVYAVSRKGR